MGVYICLGKKGHEFEPNSPFIKDVKEYMNNETTALEILKTMWFHRDEKYDDGLVIFLSSSKHKIKKKLNKQLVKIYNQIRIILKNYLFLFVYLVLLSSFYIIHDANHLNLLFLQ